MESDRKGLKVLRLAPDLIPESSFFRNLRTILKENEWDTIRSAVYRRAKHKCEACGKTDVVLDCDEVWDYNEKTGVQKLVGLLALCKDCHSVKHIGLAHVRGKMRQAINHMAKVNGVNVEVAEGVVSEAFKTWSHRSKRTWTLDLSALESLIQPH